MLDTQTNKLIFKSLLKTIKFSINYLYYISMVFLLSVIITQQILDKEYVTLIVFISIGLIILISSYKYFINNEVLKGLENLIYSNNFNRLDDLNLEKTNNSKIILNSILKSIVFYLDFLFLIIIISVTNTIIRNKGLNLRDVIIIISTFLAIWSLNYQVSYSHVKFSSNKKVFFKMMLIFRSLIEMIKIYLKVIKIIIIIAIIIIFMQYKIFQVPIKFILFVVFMVIWYMFYRIKFNEINKEE